MVKNKFKYKKRMKEKKTLKDNLLIVISSNDIETILKFPLLYASVSLPREYWKRVHVMFWGSSILSVIHSIEIKEKIGEMQQDGVEFSSCIVCAEEYDIVSKIEDLGITCNHTGLLLTKALKDDKNWAQMTI